MTKDRSVAIITGASSGIGREAAVLLAERGMQLVLVGRRRDELDKTAQMLQGAGHLAYPADLHHRASTGEIVQRVSDEFGRIDALVNNAGVVRMAPLSEGIDAQDIVDHVELNAIAPALLIAAAWPLLMKQPRACIINVSSMSTIDPFPGLFAYALSKAPMNVMVKSCVKEGTPHLRAFGIAPGCVETPMLRSILDEDQVPRDLAISPRDAATLIAECIDGRWDAHNGKVISILKEGEQVARRVVEDS